MMFTARQVRDRVYNLLESKTRSRFIYPDMLYDGKVNKIGGTSLDVTIDGEVFRVTVVKVRANGTTKKGIVI